MIPHCINFIKFLVHPMLRALDVPDEYAGRWPDFCAHIDFEFLSSKSGEERFVRILYKEKEVLLKGASNTLLPLDEFLRLTKWVIRNKSEYSAASSETFGQSNSDQDSSKKPSWG